MTTTQKFISQVGFAMPLLFASDSALLVPPIQVAVIGAAVLFGVSVVDRGQCERPYPYPHPHPLHAPRYALHQTNHMAGLG